MVERKNKFHKELRQKRKYHRKFVISTEGKITEPDYFNCLKRYSDSIIEILKRAVGKSAPMKVLNDLGTHMENNRLMKNDEAWVVIDIDNWKRDDIDSIIEFVKANRKYHCAISNPKFEFWLLMHFEEPKKALTGSGCSNALKKHIPGYDKGVRDSKITEENIRKAIERAKQRHNGTEYDYPLQNGSTVYLLAEKIIDK